MTGPSHADLNREIGGLMAGMDAINKGLDAIDRRLEKIETRLTTLEGKENERKGMMALLATIAAVVGAGISWLLQWGHH